MGRYKNEHFTGVFATFSRKFMLLYAYDTLFLKETESDMVEAEDATKQFCRDNNSSPNIKKTKYMICSRGKIRKSAKFLLIERPQGVWYFYLPLNNFQLWHLFSSCNKASGRKMLVSKCDLKSQQSCIFSPQCENRFCFLVVKYGSQDEIEETGISLCIFWRNILLIMKGRANAMLYRELGQQKLKCTVWQWKAAFQRSHAMEDEKLSNIVRITMMNRMNIFLVSF